MGIQQPTVLTVLFYPPIKRSHNLLFGRARGHRYKFFARGVVVCWWGFL